MRGLAQFMQAAKSTAPSQLIVMSSHRPATDINANAVDIFAPWGMTPPAPSSFPQPSSVTQQSTQSRTIKLGPAMPTTYDKNARTGQLVDLGAGIQDLYTEYGFRSLEREADALAQESQRSFATEAVTSFPSPYPVVEYSSPMPTMTSGPSSQMIEESLTPPAPIPVSALSPEDNKKDRTLLYLILGAIGVGALLAGMRGK